MRGWSVPKTAMTTQRHETDFRAGRRYAATVLILGQVLLLGCDGGDANVSRQAGKADQLVVEPVVLIPERGSVVSISYRRRGENEWTELPRSKYAEFWKLVESPRRFVSNGPSVLPGTDYIFRVASEQDSIVLGLSVSGRYGLLLDVGATGTLCADIKKYDPLSFPTGSAELTAALIGDAIASRYAVGPLIKVIGRREIGSGRRDSAGARGGRSGRWQVGRRNPRLLGLHFSHGGFQRGPEAGSPVAHQADRGARGATRSARHPVDVAPEERNGRMDVRSTASTPRAWRGHEDRSAPVDPGRLEGAARGFRDPAARRAGEQPGVPAAERNPVRDSGRSRHRASPAESERDALENRNVMVELSDSRDGRRERGRKRPGPVRVGIGRSVLCSGRAGQGSCDDGDRGGTSRVDGRAEEVDWL